MRQLVCLEYDVAYFPQCNALHIVEQKSMHQLTTSNQNILFKIRNKENKKERLTSFFTFVLNSTLSFHQAQ